jgi:hypothetical protein
MNMKTLKAFLICFALLALASVSSAQTLLTTTTLSGAVPNTVSSALTTGSQSSLSVASATGISAPTPNTGNTYNTATSNAQTYLYVDRELMQVTGVSGTTVNVIRGVGSTAAASHASGALVFIIPAAYTGGGNPRFGSVPEGSCTRTSELYLPHIQFTSGTISDCLGGQWVNGDASQTQRSVNFEYQYPPTGFTAYSSSGTSTTKATNTMYCTEFDLNYSKQITGLAMMNGAATGTDKFLVALYDSGGNLLANSAVAGSVASGNSTYQKRAFTAPYYAVGPAQYFACAQGDSGTTATINLIVTGTSDYVLTKDYGSQTFGTVPATITPPTAFNTANGGLWFAY